MTSAARFAVWYFDHRSEEAQVALFDGTTNYPLEMAEMEWRSVGRVHVLGMQHRDGSLVPRESWTTFLDALAAAQRRPRPAPKVVEPIGFLRDPFTGQPAAVFPGDELPPWVGEVLPFDQLGQAPEVVRG